MTAENGLESTVNRCRKLSARHVTVRCFQFPQRDYHNEFHIEWHCYPVCSQPLRRES
jgi:hypothetical protein